MITKILGLKSELGARNNYISRQDNYIFKAKNVENLSCCLTVEVCTLWPLHFDPEV